jgi:hypothetical protein
VVDEGWLIMCWGSVWRLPTAEGVTQLSAAGGAQQLSTAEVRVKRRGMLRILRAATAEVSIARSVRLSWSSLCARTYVVLEGGGERGGRDEDGMGMDAADVWVLKEMPRVRDGRKRSAICYSHFDLKRRGLRLSSGN